jgi:predicted XRE-type DNA-binding protein
MNGHTKATRRGGEKAPKGDIEVHDSSGNVFADLGLPHSEEDMLKVQIARVITATVKKRGLTQAEIGRLVGVDQAKVSAVARGRLDGFSVERLILFLVKLGRDVTFSISREHAGREGRVRVKAEAA